MTMPRLTVHSALLFCFLALLPQNALFRTGPVHAAPRGDGTSLEKMVPTKWSGTENVTWKTPIPGEVLLPGHLERPYLSPLPPSKTPRSDYCSPWPQVWRPSLATGRPQSALEAKNNENSYASATPATDGEKIFVTFQDQAEVTIAAYDFSGKQLWSVRPGGFKSQGAFAILPSSSKTRSSSPATARAKTSSSP